MSDGMIKGVALAPGVAVGQAYIIDAGSRRSGSASKASAGVEAELTRLDQAHSKSLTDLETLERKIRQELGASRAAIFRAHRLLLEDPLLISKVKSLVIDGSFGAMEAVERTREEFIEIFQRVRDPRMAERISDIRDVFQRIIGHLDDPPPALPIGGTPCLSRRGNPAIHGGLSPRTRSFCRNRDRNGRGDRPWSHIGSISWYTGGEWCPRGHAFSRLR